MLVVFVPSIFGGEGRGDAEGGDREEVLLIIFSFGLLKLSSQCLFFFFKVIIHFFFFGNEDYYTVSSIQLYILLLEMPDEV